MGFESLKICQWSNTDSGSKIRVYFMVKKDESIKDLL